MAKEKAHPKIDAEAQRLKREEQARATRRRTRQIIGFALTVLVIAGAVSIVMGGINLVRNLLDNTEDYAEYQTRFEPFVWFNVLPFDSVTTVDENTIRQVCLWGAMNITDESDMRRSENGEPLIPAIEVDQYGVLLFGPQFRFSGHGNFSDETWGLSYLFDEATQMYTMPSTGLDPQFLASVVDIRREGGGVRRVVMGYVSTRTGDNQLLMQPDYNNPATFLDYVLRRDGSSYYLTAIQPNTTYANAAPSSQPPAQDSDPLP